MEKRVISTDIMEEDYKIENSLRPRLLVDYIGQGKAKANLKVYIEAAKALHSDRVFFDIMGYCDEDDIGGNYCQRDGCES